MILIALGSNLKSSLYGMPENNCLQVIEILRKYFFVVNVSNFYRTEPIPKSNQPWYVNAAVEIKTNLKPKDTSKGLEMSWSQKMGLPHVLANSLLKC